MMSSWHRLVVALLALPLVSVAAEPPTISVDDSRQDYRRVTIDVTVVPDVDVAAYEIWFSTRRFTTRADAELHSVIRVADTSGLDRVPAAKAYDACFSAGVPVPRDADGMAVIAPETTGWSCTLTGLSPGIDHYVAVVPVDAGGIALLDRLTTVVAHTDVPDERPPAPDTRPILFALGSIVLSAIVLLSYLRYSDSRRGRSKSRLAHIYVGPALIALAALTFYPILYGIGLSFTDADQSHLGEQDFVGLANFLTVVLTPGMLRVTLFTIAWALINTSAHVFLGLVLALVLHRSGLRGKTAYRTVLLLPWAIPGYISVLAWNGMLQPDGLINVMLGTNVDFLTEITSARISVILVNIWLGVPFMMITLSGGLQALSKDMFEAAELDGVSRWDQLRYLTLPNLKGTMVPVALLGIIWSFNMFNTIYLMTRGGPYVNFGEPGATDILITYVFNVAFTYGHYGIAAAWSVLIFLMLVAFSWAYMKRTRATEATA